LFCCFGANFAAIVDTDNKPSVRRWRGRASPQNRDLSQKRAEDVMEFLISQGVEPALIPAKGFGDADAAASNDTAQGRAQNRRVELSVPASGC